jgi:hypothetical protein
MVRATTSVSVNGHNEEDDPRISQVTQIES